jgi:IMP dehydrogenase
MAATRNSSFDDPFYQPADQFFPANNKLALTFDDVTLATLFSEILPRDTQLDTSSRKICASTSPSFRPTWTP